MVMPGMQMLQDWIQAVLYFIPMVYLSLGLHMTMDRMLE